MKELKRGVLLVLACLGVWMLLDLVATQAQVDYTIGVAWDECKDDEGNVIVAPHHFVTGYGTSAGTYPIQKQVTGLSTTLHPPTCETYYINVKCCYDETPMGGEPCGAWDGEISGYPFVGNQHCLGTANSSGLRFSDRAEDGPGS